MSGNSVGHRWRAHAPSAWDRTTVWHANEGHSAFLTLERIRELVHKGTSHAEASEMVRQKHGLYHAYPGSSRSRRVSPLSDGPLLSPAIGNRSASRERSSCAWERRPNHAGKGFNMTALVIRLSAHVNGVSRNTDA